MLRQRIEPAVKVLAPCSKNIASVLQDPDLVLGALAVSLATDSLGSDVVKEVIDAANSVVRENLFVVMLCRLYNPRVLG
jgi:selenophosphate synthase